MFVSMILKLGGLEQFKREEGGKSKQESALAVEFLMSTIESRSIEKAQEIVLQTQFKTKLTNRLLIHTFVSPWSNNSSTENCSVFS